MRYILIRMWLPLLLALVACESRSPQPAEVGVPFAGPVKDAKPSQDEKTVATREPADEPKGSESAAPERPTPVPPPVNLDERARRIMDIWLGEEFRCKAISTARLRDCKFEKTDTGVRLDLHKGVFCGDVEFGSDGHPAKLLRCSCDWINIPAEAKLSKHRHENSWSGSHRGWTWPDDDTKYCCPGMWITAPKGLEELLSGEEAKQVY